MRHLTEDQRLQMIETALRDRAPVLYKELKKAGQLPQFLEERDELLMESFAAAYSQRITELSLPPVNPDFLDLVQEYETAQRECWEQALTTWLEFADETTPLPLAS